MVVASVIGGAGRMGAWFATFLKKNGYQVLVCDRNKSAARNLARKRGFRLVEDLTLAVRSAQLVILATPTQVTQKILQHIEPHLSSRKLLVEISSVKEPLRRILQDMRRRGVAILSIHPMFGPGIKTLAGTTILTVSVPARNILAQEFLSLLRKRGAKLIRSDFDEHDKLVSMILTLPHFMNIAMVNTLRTLDADPNQLREIAGTSFKLQLLIAETIYQEAIGNEASILMDSKCSLKMLRRFAQESAASLNIIKKNKRSILLRSLHGGRYFVQKDRFFDSAYDRFNAAVEASSVA